MREDFQDGCDKITQALTAQGVTPASASPDDIASSIRTMKKAPDTLSFYIQSSGGSDYSGSSHANSHLYYYLNLTPFASLGYTRWTFSIGGYNTAGTGVTNIPTSGSISTPFTVSSEGHWSYGDRWFNGTLTLYK